VEASCIGKKWRNYLSDARNCGKPQNRMPLWVVIGNRIYKD
jgi:hypothetical protein